MAHRVVMDLLAPSRLTNIRVSLDNFYTGVPLLQQLHSEGICGVGTIRTNPKHLPKELLPKIAPLAKHNYKVAQAGELTFSVWMDSVITAQDRQVSKNKLSSSPIIFSNCSLLITSNLKINYHWDAYIIKTKLMD